MPVATQDCRPVASSCGQLRPVAASCGQLQPSGNSKLQLQPVATPFTSGNSVDAENQVATRPPRPLELQPLWGVAT